MIAKLVSDSVPARRLLWMASGVFDYSLFLYTKRDFTTLRIGSLFDNPGFETINEGFGTNDYMLGGYFTPIEIQIKDMAAGIKRKTGQENARSAITAMRQTVCRQLGYFGEI